jgi:2-phosphosulfolactate phosphatase
MQLDVLLLPAELPARPRPERVAAVVDVIRATTSIVAACRHGARAVFPAASTAEAEALAADRPAALLAGERGGARIPGFAAGNSPREFTRDLVRERDLILTTSNGTRTLRAVGAGRRVAIAAFLNRTAVGRWLARQQEDGLIVCSGYEGIFSLEDAVCAGSIVEAAAQGGDVTLGDGAQACRVLWEQCGGDLPRLLQESGWGRQVIARGFGADLAVCAELDVTEVLPVMEEGRIAAALPPASRPGTAGS